MGQPVQPARIQYLEGLRGLAAVQVVLLHFVLAFLPVTAERAAPPLRILWDGHTAVYVFFLISGAVLTPSFTRGGPWFRQVARRMIRLGLPVAAAASLALALLVAMPDAHVAAARVTGSDWLAMDSSAATTVGHLLREISLDSLLTGYREYTLFTPIADRLPLLENALNAPSWSLHLELYGSFLVLALVMLQRRMPRLHTVTVATCAMLFGAHPMFLFVIGHICAPLLSRAGRPLIGAALLGLGLAVSASKDWTLLETLRVAISWLEPETTPNMFQFQSQVAAVALFAGVLSSPLAHRLLALCRPLGRLSFSIYLLHFPILFTVACVGFMPLAAVMPLPIAAVLTFAGFAIIVLLAATVFESMVDQRAVRWSRLVDRPSRQ